MRFDSGLFRTITYIFVYSYAATMVVTPIYCLINSPDATFTFHYFLYAMLFSLAVSLCSLVYCCRSGELTQKQYLVRTIFHTILLEAVALTAGYFIGMWDSLRGGLLFAFFVLAADVMVNLLLFSRDSRDAKEINSRLKERNNRTSEDN